MPHFLKSMQNIEKTMSLVNTPSMKAMGGLQSKINATTLKALKGFQLPGISLTTIKAIEKIQMPIINSATLKALEGIQLPEINPATLKIMEEFQSTTLNLSTVKSLAGIKNTGLLNSFKLEALAGSPANGILKLSSLDGIQLATPHMSPATLTALQSLQTNFSKQALGVLNLVENFPFNSAIDNLELPDLANKDDLDVVDRSKLEENLLIEVTESLGSSKDFQSLPNRSKAILLYFYHVYIVPFLIGLFLILNQEGFLDLQKQLFTAESPAHAKKIMDAQSLTSDNELLKGYRVTKTRLHLRDKPKMNSDIIFTLPRYTLLTVIDKSKRSWIFVQVQINDEQYEGWVSRRYTAYFR